MANSFLAWWSLRRQGLHVQRMARAPARIPVTVRLIASGNLVKAVIFIIAGLWLGRLIHAPDATAWAAAVLGHIHIDPDGQRAQRLIAWVGAIPHQRLVQVDAGMFFYAALYAIEGLGLWFDRRWAEWLTVVGTVVYIPFETVHLARHPSPGIAIVLAVNLAIAGYLGRRLWRRSSGGG